MTNGVFTATNSDTHTAIGSATVKWNNNIQNGTIKVTDESSGNSQTFTLNTQTITEAYSANNISIPCGVTGYVTFEVRIRRADNSGSLPQGVIVGSKNFTLPSGWSYVSNTYTGDGTEFGVDYQKYQVTLNASAASGIGYFRSALSCSSDPNSTGILGSTSVPFNINRTAGSLSFSSTPQQIGPYYLNCTSGSSQLFTASSIPGNTYIWTVVSGNLLIEGQTSYTSFVGASANVTAYGDGTFKVVGQASGCGNVQTDPIYGSIHVGPPVITNLTINSQPQSSFSGGMCTGQGLYIESSSIAASSFSWAITSGNAGNAYLTDYTNGNASFNTYNADCYGLNLTVSNSCGMTQTGFSVCADNCFSAYRIYPNPASDVISIEFDETNEAEQLPDKIELFSEESTRPLKSVNIQEIYQQKSFKGRSVEIQVKELSRGTYYLHVNNSRRKKKEVDSIRIILQ